MRTWLSAVVIVFLIFAVTIIAHAEGKIYIPKDPKYGTKKQYTNQQKEHRGLNDKKKTYTTCRLQKRIKSRVTGRQACIYIGGNKTYTLMYENNCPKQYKCVYNPWQKEPSIDDVVDSLNSIKKGNN
tara:strand:+ start:72 stop:452 length:381 start_codon:yes stop_codon:yes gene_type:complete